MLSPFRMGLILGVAGAALLGAAFAGTEKAGDVLLLEPSTSGGMAVELAGPSLGYYRVHMPEFARDEVFVQMLDPHGNVIQEDVIRTRLSVGYFDYAEPGRYEVRVANISGGDVAVGVEVGRADSRQMIPAGAVLIAGVLVMMVSAYHRIKTYSTAQPDENIS